MYSLPSHLTRYPLKVHVQRDPLRTVCIKESAPRRCGRRDKATAFAASTPGSTQLLPAPDVESYQLRLGGSRGDLGSFDLVPPRAGLGCLERRLSLCISVLLGNSALFFRPRCDWRPSQRQPRPPPFSPLEATQNSAFLLRLRSSTRQTAWPPSTCNWQLQLQLQLQLHALANMRWRLQFIWEFGRLVTCATNFGERRGCVGREMNDGCSSQRRVCANALCSLPWGIGRRSLDLGDVFACDSSSRRPEIHKSACAAASSFFVFSTVLRDPWLVTTCIIFERHARGGNWK